MTPVDVGVIGSVERLGLVGVLIFAVGVLWRDKVETQRKRDLERESDRKVLMDVMVKTAEALTLATETMQEFRAVVTDLRCSVEKLVTVRETLEDHAGKRRS